MSLKYLAHHKNYKSGRSVNFIPHNTHSSFLFLFSFRFVSFRFVSFRVVSCRVVSCRRFVSFRFLINLIIVTQISTTITFIELFVRVLGKNY